MKIAFLFTVGLLLGPRYVCGQVPSASPIEKSFDNVASFARELRQFEHSLTLQNADQVRVALPSSWRLRTPDGDYSISTLPLREFLERASPKVAGNAALERAQNWLNHLAGEIESYDSKLGQVSGARAHLERILARPEFAQNAPPNAWERFWERIGLRIARWLQRLFAFSRAHSTTSAVFFWVALVGAVALLALFLLRIWRRDRYNFKLSGAPPALPLRRWQQWLQAARTASNEGDLRSAIQCAYWAGVARLQESKALPANAAHTPREYLRLLSSVPQFQAANVPLRTLTSHLERFWYASADASAEDFSACLGSLEALGCKVD